MISAKTERSVRPGGWRALPLLGLLLWVGCAGPGPVEHRAAPGALGPYSGSVSAAGLVFVSGKIGERGGSFEREAATALEAVGAELARAGCALGDVVSVTVYLTDMELYGAFNAVYAEALPRPHPARVCVAVAALPGGARVEVAATAVAR